VIPPLPTGQLLADRGILHAMRKRIGHQSAELLLDLTDLAEDTADGRIVEASLRAIATFAASSKDTVRRSLAQLERHQLIELLNPEANQFATPRYLLHLDVAGISIAA
jgi:hypothetical protein